MCSELRSLVDTARSLARGAVCSAAERASPHLEGVKSGKMEGDAFVVAAALSDLSTLAELSGYLDKIAELVGEDGD